MKHLILFVSRSTMMRRIFFQPVRHASSGSGSGGMHGTTILCVRKANQLAMIGDGQVTLGNTVVKPNANKLRKLPKFNICI
jgi:hypothetical protein